jgi:hypothetical protein
MLIAAGKATQAERDAYVASHEWLQRAWIEQGEELEALRARQPLN